MKNFLKALVIDDEPQICRFVGDVLEADGWMVSEANSAEEGIEMLDRDEWLLIFCDVMLGETNGYQVLKSYADSDSKARFILMTGQGSAAGALDAMAFGAYDYLLKPFSVGDVQKIAQTVFEQYQAAQNHHQNNLNSQNGSLNSQSIGEQIAPAAIPQPYVSEIPLIGVNARLVECLKTVGRVAVTNLPVLISGESGTGKEIVARAIHQRSQRAGRSFVPVNCGAIPFELIESELFGHARGAFTGAQTERRGLWEEADGGTIFLDEITETSLLFQVKLLRALQEGEIRRVGSNRVIKADVRVIAATNRDIEKEVSEGRFRQDLMYRLNAVTINLPPLRERREDIPVLIEHFTARQARENNRMIKFSVTALDLLQNYSWAGNIRELENAVLHATSLSSEIVYPEHLPAHILRQNDIGNGNQDFSFVSDTGNSADGVQGSPEEWPSLEEMEARYVARVLAATKGNKQAASRILKIDRKTLTRILERDKSKG